MIINFLINITSIIAHHINTNDTTTSLTITPITYGHSFTTIDAYNTRTSHMSTPSIAWALEKYYPMPITMPTTHIHTPIPPPTLPIRDCATCPVFKAGRRCYPCRTPTMEVLT